MYTPVWSVRTVKLRLPRPQINRQIAMEGPIAKEIVFYLSAIVAEHDKELGRTLCRAKLHQVPEDWTASDLN